MKSNIALVVVVLALMTAGLVVVGVGVTVAGASAATPQAHTPCGQTRTVWKASLPIHQPQTYNLHLSSEGRGDLVFFANAFNYFDWTQTRAARCHNCTLTLMNVQPGWVQRVDLWLIARADACPGPGIVTRGFRLEIEEP